MFFKRILPISIIFLASIVGLWRYKNPCVESVDYTHQYGWQGENPFAIKIERIPERCSFAAAVGGANYVFSAQQGNSENWRQIMVVRHDDPIDFPNDNIQIVSEKIAYTFFNGKCAVTMDGGKNWNIWSIDEIPHWNFLEYGYINEVNISEDGSGFLRLNPMGKHQRPVRFHTSDFGKNWEQIN